MLPFAVKCIIASNAGASPGYHPRGQPCQSLAEPAGWDAESHRLGASFSPGSCSEARTTPRIEGNAVGRHRGEAMPTRSPHSRRERCQPARHRGSAMGDVALSGNRADSFGTGMGGNHEPFTFRRLVSVPSCVTTRYLSFGRSSHVNHVMKHGYRSRAVRRWILAPFRGRYANNSRNARKHLTDY
jgi:hypothetical protein